MVSLSFVGSDLKLIIELQERANSFYIIPAYYLSMIIPFSTWWILLNSLLSWRFPKGLILGSCTILETAGQGALVPVYQTLQSSVIKDGTVTNSGRVIWVHFGVNSGVTMFAIEHQAVNEATFRCPGEMGCKVVLIMQGCSD
ncbi:unnamed protein product [Fraxinus pennsylvanica]|uniref:Uncharacterized protein n=1 Tax=Fraxinus pennsylvanica TaxID=56036 RepID=A0AAD2AAT6_9LAMI|nr:unnamed protein product [Fraxinus pennsylvanica]